ncbi:FAD-dependent oxidoreductase [Nocardioides sp. zg-536]|uniref:FAD-dependent oxidoreductase n=1 Tax=Nocardioides faecalis TaxID=2803858 RepID=A0A938Y314_9ACTN|nr:FAD-dependent oxidoreductase [Nocardioides faecalis]MBM9459063.1 FAD-dependent oxidoreductase [Nocardioides faecalis]QVI57326.1 FAD-dependent oxidoreductase [Nocardioides faecalis]
MDAPEHAPLLPVDSRPVWFEGPRPDPRPSATGATSYDVAVVGAGIAGLTTALLLARAGRRVAVLEARRIGDGTTGHTTGKVSLLQGTKLSRAVRTNPPAVVRDYVEASREGQAWLRHYCERAGMDVTDRHATTYATTRVGELRARAELAAAQLVGLDATWVEETELPYEVRGAVRLDGQFQLDPLVLLRALVADAEAEGAVVLEGSRVRRVRQEDDVVRLDVDTEAGEAQVRAEKVVIATNQPILDRGGFFARVQAQRSYAATVSGSWIPDGMHLSSDRPTRSLRSVTTVDGEELLQVGGSGHGTGRGRESDHVADLLGWADQTFPGSEVRHVWSAQDQTPATALPYVGPVLPGDDAIHVLTGFDKWGMTTAPAAALLLAAELLGGSPPAWGRALRAWTPREVASIGRTAFFNAEVGWHMVSGHVQRPLRRDQAPLCTHLGGVLCWNDAEESWDCPLHGSRFDADGQVLEGPATRPL